MELKKELSQKQTYIDNLKKELQSKIGKFYSLVVNLIRLDGTWWNECSKLQYLVAYVCAANLQSELNQLLTEKDVAQQEVLATKLAAERSERQNRQEQSRLQIEVNSYKQRLERTEADLVHVRRENSRLSEQIACLEKEARHWTLSVIKINHCFLFLIKNFNRSKGSFRSVLVNLYVQRIIPQRLCQNRKMTKN